jgi:hypothetical protein
MIEQTIYAILEDIAPTYPLHHQKLYPCLTYSVIAATEKYSYDGNSNLKEIVVQINAWDTTYAGAKNLQQAIFNSLDAYQSYEIRNVFLENKQDLYENETGIYYCVTDYRVQYVEV